MKSSKYGITAAIIFLFSSVAIFSQISFNSPESPAQWFIEAEFGTIAVTHHTLKFGENGTSFDYRTMGGQELLFPFARVRAGVQLFDSHNISVLYQPLTINTNVVFKEAVRIDNTLFSAGTPMELQYGFPFYRLTYGYDFFTSDQIDLGIGAALQIRNASIIFKEESGTVMTVNQNLGPVPAVHLFGRYVFPFGLTLSTDITGLWASSSIINGASFDFEGSILDASIRAGWFLNYGLEFFTNVRFLGGSAVGTSSYPIEFWTQGQEKYTENYLATFAVTAGLTLR